MQVPAIQYTCYTLLWGRYLLYGHLGAVTGLATSSLGDMLVSVGQDRVAKLWRLAGTGTSLGGTLIPFKSDAWLMRSNQRTTPSLLFILAMSCMRTD